MKGDIRMKYKMENPDKVRNLVEGSYSELTDLYFPLLLDAILRRNFANMRSPPQPVPYQSHNIDPPHTARAVSELLLGKWH